MKAIFTLTVVLATIVTTGDAMAQDNAGSNTNGNEKVCVISLNGQNEQGLVDALKNCKRGDILSPGWLPMSTAMQICDFTKAVVYNQLKGNVIACVYTGARRQEVK